MDTRLCPCIYCILMMPFACDFYLHRIALTVTAPPNGSYGPCFPVCIWR